MKSTESEMLTEFILEVNTMALSNLFDWNKKEEVKATAACGSACGTGDKPAEQPAACGSACGVGDNQ